VPRIAKQRGLSEDKVREAVRQHTESRQFGFLGEPRVNVLELNLTLDEISPKPGEPLKLVAFGRISVATNLRLMSATSTKGLLTFAKQKASLKQVHIKVHKSTRSRFPHPNKSTQADCK
jgi:K+-transporting ATPase, c chain